ncbi:uncharacterized protein FOMMEDRAFT_170963 [Fomitiporia mediterranea MF3/22]|uniref:uncharacterized protein n=1 Tax=Fomitiporia mediterranea (strain MF3/22) TaxID=694068 RepID=UPI0004407855|nr:uncharacterized protein FOMMEDRAFT_170963 [Fomitiporia mediterranea MF3/22]EJC98762.1 hypothetical protein FOMMEDRAFT_170963 [Fomitiporia mediterranea MF3/22]
MATSAKDALELVNSIKGITISAHIDTACFALLFYDYLLTLEDELKLIWQSKWSFPKAVFLITRYGPVIDLSIVTAFHFKSATPDECLRIYKAGGMLLYFGICFTELIPVLRTWAIWGKSRTITILLFIWSAINLGISAVLVTLYFNSAQFTSLPAGVPGCLVSNANSFIVGSWSILVVFESGILGITVLKGVQLYKEYEDKQLRNSALFNAVFTNGAIFYVYIFAISVGNVIVVRSLPREFVQLLASVERVSHALLTGRLFIAIRRAAVHGTDEEDLTRLETLRFQESHIGPIDTKAGASSFMSSSVGNWTCLGHSASTASGKEPVNNMGGGGEFNV